MILQANMMESRSPHAARASVGTIKRSWPKIYPEEHMPRQVCEPSFELAMSTKYVRLHVCPLDA